MLTRFAPSPTGYLHIGNIRTALICYLYTKKAGGKFMLRIDDTDKERSKQEYIKAIKNDLKWLGIEYDICANQSERFAKYDEAVEKLKESGRLYPCFETAEELEFKRKVQLGRGQPPVYDRSSLNLSKEEKQKFLSEDRKPHYRFLLEDKQIEWEDEIRGKISLAPTTMSDPILIRETGDYTYMLPSTVDDIEFGVTHVLRGEDHISNTAIQLQMFEALGGSKPVFAHNSLIKTKEGKISKREGKGSVAELRDAGIQPMAINSYLAKLGSSDNIELKGNLKQLIEEFDIKKFSISPSLYDAEDIKRLNVKILHESSFGDIKEKLPEYITEEFWNNIRANIEDINDAKTWWEICNNPKKVEFDDSDKEFLKKAANLLPEGEITEETWGSWTGALKRESGRKGKQLFMPLRLALTGLEHGPELKNLLGLLGREKILERLTNY